MTRTGRPLAAALLLAAVAAADPFPGYEALRQRAAAARKDAPARPAAYLVLLPEGSPLAPAVRALAEYRRAEIVPFSPARPEASLETLVRKGARHVAVFVEPEDMDVNLLRRMIVLSTLLDEDPFCDFAFGFFTGSSPAKTMELVERSIRADREGVKRRAIQWNTSNINQRYEGWSFLDGVPGDSWFVKLGDVPYAMRSLKEVEGAGFVHFGGCADPEGIWLFDDKRNGERDKHWPYDPKRVGEDPRGEMPRMTADSFRGLDLGGAVVWTHACHIGSVGRIWVEGDIVSTFGRCEKVEEYRVPPEKSVALAILDAGACAYLAPLGPNFGMQAHAERDIAVETGMPLGDVLRRGYHDIVMDTGGHPEKIGIYVTGKPARWDPDDFTNHNSPHHRALYGDPLLRPFGDFKGPPAVDIGVTDKGAYSFVVRKSGYQGRTWYGNRGADPGRARFYEVIRVPGARRATVVSATMRGAKGEELPVTRAAALLEEIDGETLLHIQVVTSDGEAMRAEGASAEVSVRLE